MSVKELEFSSVALSDQAVPFSAVPGAQGRAHWAGKPSEGAAGTRSGDRNMGLVWALPTGGAVRAEISQETDKMACTCSLARIPSRNFDKPFGVVGVSPCPRGGQRSDGHEHLPQHHSQVRTRPSLGGLHAGSFRRRAEQ